MSSRVLHMQETAKKNCVKLERNWLLSNLKKSVQICLLADQSAFSKRCQNEGESSSSYAQIQTTLADILTHGLRLADDETKYSSTSCDGNALAKLIDDFEWLRRSAQIRDSPLTDKVAPVARSTSEGGAQHLLTASQFLRSWVWRNMRANCLCASLQALHADRELLECHYDAEAFMRSDRFATALFICVSALEQRQCSLLSQIDVALATTTGAGFGAGAVKHKRCSSHPNFSLSPLPRKQSCAGRWPTRKMNVLQPATPPTTATVFSTFRKVKSLPQLQASMTESLPRAGDESRPRSKTLSLTAASTQPLNIPTKSKLPQRWPAAPPTTTATAVAVTPSSLSSSTSASVGNDMQPCTSTNSSSSRSVASNHTATTTTYGSSPHSTTTTARRIELIKCDDIKIWTDRSAQLRQQQPTTPKRPSASCAIPAKEECSVKQAKSVSPINSFLCHLFGTPPTRTVWSHNYNEPAADVAVNAATVVASPVDDGRYDAVAIAEATTALDDTTVGAFPTAHRIQQSPNAAGSVFDAFLPVYGKKLRSRKSQTLFDEDGISSLDYSLTSSSSSRSACRTNSTPECATATANASPKAAPKNCESLTAFLQMAQMSRNYTQLEKENAHFRISEAIISAIEHIKCAKLEPDKRRAQHNCTTCIASDWLANEERTKSNHNAAAEVCSEARVQAAAHLKAQLPDAQPSPNMVAQFQEEEHIPYAELGESCLNLLSAEVVGLSLIAKFNEKQLPKVSELKWLVSEEDAPQQLLPLPMDSGSTNPDDNVRPSMMRGTKYWAPPRPQIIFTDHPLPNRKEVIQKQSNRCAGCGMRVSPQYVHSFRYCTYLGKYHCTGCHRNQISATPAKILHAWDVKCYPVSVFAYRLLEQMYTCPLFNVPDLNPALYMQSKALLAARQKRVQLKFIRDFVRACRFATREQNYFASIPDYITNDPDTWSMSDFIDTHNKSMHHAIDDLIAKCERHIFHCVLCTARGFHCESCDRGDVIYPWSNNVFRCDRCGVCFHTRCWKSMLEICSRCQRMSRRRDKIALKI